MEGISFSFCVKICIIGFLCKVRMAHSTTIVKYLALNFLNISSRLQIIKITKHTAWRALSRQLNYSSWISHFFNIFRPLLFFLLVYVPLCTKCSFFSISISHLTQQRREISCWKNIMWGGKFLFRSIFLLSLLD